VETEMSLELKPMLDYKLPQAADIITRAFAGYHVNIEIDGAKLSEMIVQDGIGVGDSRVVLRDGEVVAAALIARRGWSSRLAGMAVVPGARGQGIGGWLTEILLAESRERGERRMELEVIESNTAGVRLYEKCGFQRIRRLVDFSARGLRAPQAREPGAAGGIDAELEEIDIRDVARAVTAFGLSDLPWQLSGETLAQFGPPYAACAMSGAYAVISDAAQPSVIIRSVLVEPGRRREGRAARLLRALMASHPAQEWRVPALCPEEMAPLFERSGFVRGSLSQIQMAIQWA
jgi:ribosomal protein S18 acetylase RimI-like enzyme